MKKRIKILIVCPLCGSDNVEERCWSNPNDNSVSRPYEPDDSDCYCCDCETHNVLVPKEYPNNGTKVVGFQVVSDNRNIHPAMAGSFCLYSLSQANEMLMDNPKEKFKLKAVYTREIEKPTIMFEGKDPRI
jgi:hypothetical protein